MERFAKKVVLFAACLIAALTFCGFIGCGQEEPNSGVDGLSDEKVTEIRRAYFEQFYKGDGIKYNINEIKILTYLGTYDGHIAVKLKDNADIETAVPEVVIEVIIDGIHIGSLGNANYKYMLYMSPEAKSEKALLNLKEANEKGYVSKIDLQEIAAFEKKTT